MSEDRKDLLAASRARRHAKRAAERWVAAKFEPLAVYNAEVARGIVHTPEWDAQMAVLRREFDQALADHGVAP